GQILNLAAGDYSADGMGIVANLRRSVVDSDRFLHVAQAQSKVSRGSRSRFHQRGTGSTLKPLHLGSHLIFANDKGWEAVVALLGTGFGSNHLGGKIYDFHSSAGHGGSRRIANHTGDRASRNLRA